MNPLQIGNGITLADRLAHGFLSIEEVCALKLCGKSQVYLDIKAGVLPTVKHGRSTRIAGPDAASYVPGARRMTNAA